MPLVTFSAGAARAMLAAGPIFVLTLVFGSLLLEPGALDLSASLAIVPILMASVVFGMMFSLIPILVGSWAMASASVKWPLARRHEIWAAAGAILGMALVLPLDSPGAPNGWEAYALMAFTGAICAVIVRYGTRWFDESV